MYEHAVATTFDVIVAQVTDTIPAQMTSNRSAKQFERDTLETQKVSPLDITDDRGIYILTKDGNMQLRILGSVRFAINDDFVILPVQNTFNTYYIPTGDDNIKINNFNSSLGQTRLGFEVSRKLKNNNVFIRLETRYNYPQFLQPYQSKTLIIRSPIHLDGEGNFQGP